MKKTFLTIILASIIALSYTLTANADVSISVDVGDNHNGIVEKPHKGGLLGLFHRKNKKPEIKNDKRPNEPAKKPDIKNAAPNMQPDMQKDLPKNQGFKK